MKTQKLYTLPELPRDVAAYYPKAESFANYMAQLFHAKQRAYCDVAILTSQAEQVP